MLSPKEIIRYQRHIQLTEIGIIGQEKIKNSSILVVGAGGLGCPILQYLTAMGIGTIGIIDFDIVSETNLQRQTTYTAGDIGKYKVDVSVQKLSRQNPYVKFVTYCHELNNKNALEILANYDLIIDGTDNFITRYIINDACLILNKPFIFGAIHKYQGQVSVFNYKALDNQRKICYRDLFPEVPDQFSAPNCSDVGVLGVLPGIIGTIQAAEAIKIILGIGEVLSGELLVFNLLEMSTSIFKICPSKSKKIIGINEFKEYDYKGLCSANAENRVKEISCKNLYIEVDKYDLEIIDVRDKDELPKIIEFGSKNIPLIELMDRFGEININKKVVFICKSGIRSKLAVQMLQKKYQIDNLYSLSGGITEYLKLIK